MSFYDKKINVAHLPRSKLHISTGWQWSDTSLVARAVTESHSPSSRDCLTSQWVASVGALPLQYKVDKKGCHKKIAEVYDFFLEC